MAERVKFTYDENPRWWRPPYWILKNVYICRLGENITTKFGGQMYYGHMEIIAGTPITLLTTTRWLLAYMYSIALATSTANPLASTCPHLRCDVGLEEGKYRENCLCVAVLCIIVMVHKGMSSSYRLVDCIGLWSCLVYLSVFQAPPCLRSSWCCIYTINKILLHPSLYLLVSWAWWDWPLTWLTNRCSGRHRRRLVAFCRTVTVTFLL